MKSTLRMIIWLLMLGGGIWGGFILDARWFPGIHHLLWFHILSFLIGIVVLKGVMTVSRNTGRTLAKYGRKGELPRMETNQLVKEGPYRYMRHPMHLGLLFFPFAFAFLVGSPAFILVIAPAEAVLMLLLIRWVEEPEAIRKFGDEYRKYQQQVPWFCIRKECLNALFRKVEKNIR